MIDILKNLFKNKKSAKLTSKDTLIMMRRRFTYWLFLCSGRDWNSQCSSYQDSRRTNFTEVQVTDLSRAGSVWTTVKDWRVSHLKLLFGSTPCTYSPLFLFSGAFSNVFKARDKETGKLVAIKVAQKRELNDVSPRGYTRHGIETHPSHLLPIEKQYPFTSKPEETNQSNRSK